MKDIIFSTILIVMVAAAIVWMALYAVAACRIAPANTRNIIEVFIYFGIMFVLLESIAIAILVESVRKYKNNKL